jgi:hypothetical protein
LLILFRGKKNFRGAFPLVPLENSTDFPHKKMYERSPLVIIVNNLVSNWNDLTVHT